MGLFYATQIFLIFSAVTVIDGFEEDSLITNENDSYARLNHPITKPNGSSNGLVVVVVVLAGVIFFIIIALVIGIYIWKNHRRSVAAAASGKGRPYKLLQNLTEDPKHALTYNALRLETARLIAMGTVNRGVNASGDAKAIDEYLLSIADPKFEEEAEKAGLLDTVPGCRKESIHIRKDTRVVLREGRVERRHCLHMNKLHDYYRNSLLLCQAPLEEQFAEHWEAIWQEMVGVVVWIGGLMERGRPKIDAYISLIEGETVACGPVTIRTTLVVTTENEYNVYWVSATRGQNDRELVFIHVHMWADHRTPDEPAKLADVVAHIQAYQMSQAKTGLPALMAHCSLGVQRSPALLAVYIGRQMWLDSRKVNILGILQYIHRHRWRAFVMGNPFAQVQIVFGVLQVIATRHYTEAMRPLNAEDHEKPVFDAAYRRQDVESAQREKWSG